MLTQTDNGCCHTHIGPEALGPQSAKGMVIATSVVHLYERSGVLVTMEVDRGLEIVQRGHHQCCEVAVE